MALFFIILGIIFILILLAIPVAFAVIRKNFRTQKNYERGLKVVPLYIHLPPSSDDTEVGSRDARDVTEETISKSQIIYNIIASTLQKGFKSKFYGQRSFSFEIIGSQGFIYFYAAVPVALVEVVKQAVVSAYPTARLDEVADHNIFNQVGKINGTLGGEFNLKEKYAYPIATYQDTKRDAMLSLLNAMSSLGKEDGVAIQILMRPADPSWRKAANGVASSKRKGNDKKLAPLDIFKNLAVALVKPPENKDGGDKKPELSNLDQSTLDSIDEKTRHPGYETLIRVVVSSNISQRSQAILSNIRASFSLYDAPGKNGFSYTPAKDVEELVSGYLLRLFPQSNNRNILNSVELATLFHFPDERSMPTSQVSRQESKQVDGPRNVPEQGLLLGYNVFRGAKKPIRLDLSDRQRHMYVVGQTGTGKSTFLEDMALQDMLSGNGFAFVDPHGDTAEKLLSMVPKERTEDVIYFSPADMDYPMGLNLFEFHNADQKDFLIQEALNMLYKLYDPQHSGIMGPRYEDMFRNAALAVMADPAGGTFIDIPQLFRDPQYLKQKLQYVKDQTVLDFWQKQFPASQRSNDSGEVTAWFVSKFGAFLSNEMMRNIIGQSKSAFNLRDIMDNKKILLVNLSKGRTGELNSKLLGMVFVMKFQAAAMSRSDIPEKDRVDFSLYVDEFQNFSTDSFATIMSEARKYHLNLIVANQFTTQLSQEIRDAVFGNMGTIVSFRIGQNDVESIGKYFSPVFDSDDLLRVPNYNAITRTLINGVPTQPFSMVALPPLGSPNPKLADALKQLSAAKYGRPKAIVEKEIFSRITIQAPAVPAPAFNTAPAVSPSPLNGIPNAMPTGPRPVSASQAPTAPAGGGSFLDEWLAKRKAPPAPTAMVAPTAAPSPYQPPAPAAAPVAAVTAPLAVSPAPPIAAKPQVSAHRERVLSPISEPQKPLDTSLLNDEPASIPKTTPAVPAEPASAVNQPDLTAQANQSTVMNISSDELEKQEVDRIAEELRQRLKQPKPASQLAENTPVEGEIIIDRDGTLRQVAAE